MTAQTYVLPRKERMYVTTEVTFDTVVDHAGTDIVPMLGEATLGYARGETELADKKDTVGPSAFIRDGKYTSPWAYPKSHLKTSDSASAAPQLGKILKAWFGQQNAGNLTDTVQASPAPTTTSFAIGTMANAPVGSIIRLTSGTYSGSICFVTANSGTALTVAPALAGAPSSSDALSIGYSYTLTQDNAESIDVFHEVAHSFVAASGCMCNSLGIGVGNQGTLQMEASGEGSGRVSFSGSSAVGSGGITNVATSLPVTAGDGYKFLIDGSLPIYVTIQAEGGNTEETVKISAGGGSSDTLTIARAQKSTSASAHAEGAVIVPWSPTLTKVGTPRAGLVGVFKLGGSTFSMHTFDFKGENGFQLLDNNLGSTFSPGFARNGVNPRKVNVDVSGKFSKDWLIQIGKAVANGSTSLYIQVGTTAASIFAMYFPAFRPAIPAISAGGSPVATAILSGPCLETSGNDECYCGFI